MIMNATRALQLRSVPCTRVVTRRGQSANAAARGRAGRNVSAPVATAAPDVAAQPPPVLAADSRRAVLLTAMLAPVVATGVTWAPAANAATLRAQTRDEKAAFEQVMDNIFSDTGEYRPERYTPILLRIAFHDAGTYVAADRRGGPNGSLAHELNTVHNRSVVRRFGWPIVLQIQEQLRGTAAETFSLGDIMALAPAYGLSKMGGGEYNLKVGRKDASRADFEPDEGLPDASDKLEELQQVFGKSGFNLREIVVLSGAHTIGRIPGVGGDVFDNSYYKALLEFRPGLGSDIELVRRDETKPLVEEYARNNRRFIEDFRDAYTKLSNLGHNA